MDAAATAPAGAPNAPDVVEPFSLGVPSLPAPAGRVRPPLPVPSAPIPAEDWSSAEEDWSSAEEDWSSADRDSSGPGASVPASAAGDAGEAAGTGLGPVDNGPGAFGPGVSTKLGAYVYLLVDPRTGRPFYVGRGRGDRCFRHVRAARLPPDPGEADEKYPLLDRIREVESSGRAVRVDVLRYGLSSSEAQLVEASTQDALGLQLHPKLGSQRRPAAELNTSLAKRAKFKQYHQVVLLRVAAQGSDASYDVARHGWRIGRRWTDPRSPRSPRWAVIVVGEMVASVHRIDRWEATALRSRSLHGSSVTAAQSTYRFSFVGPVDTELQKRYAGRSVAGYLGSGNPSPVTYVWCGPHWVDATV